MVFVVVELFQGTLRGVHGPFDSLKRAEKKARELCPKPSYSNEFLKMLTSDKKPPEYPAEPDTEVYVYRVSKAGGTRYLTLAK
jgi:hypothetical protein